MKRFLIFGGECYYPVGGFCDVIAEADTFEEADRLADRLIGGRGYFEENAEPGSWGLIIEWVDVVDTIGKHIHRYGEEPHDRRGCAAGQIVEVRDSEGVVISKNFLVPDLKVQPTYDELVDGIAGAVDESGEDSPAMRNLRGLLGRLSRSQFPTLMQKRR